MRKNKQPKSKSEIRISSEPLVGNPIKPGFNKQVSLLYLTIVITCIALYINTYNNKYCLDDAMMITQNRITQKGFNGIKEHLSHGFLYGFLPPGGNKNAGSSRWRPLPLITYSMEIGLWGNDKPQYSHLLNILLYAVLCLLLFHVLRKYLLKDLWLSFFATLLFAIHPIHTEVVANIKGRDELLCLFLMLFSIWSLSKFIISNHYRYYLLSLLLYFISLTAKENSFTFIAGIPLILYFFFNLKNTKILLYSGGFLLTALVFILIRNSIVPVSDLKPATEIMNNPFLYAKGLESVCTKVYVLLLYVRMLIFPFPLSYDYSFNQIPYVNLNNFWMWTSVVIYLSLFIVGLRGIKQKNIYSFCILMYLITLSVSTNLVVEIGLILGERLLFLPSVFICILFALIGNKLINYIVNKTKLSRGLLAGVLILPILIFSSIVIIARNREWKDDITLNLADVKKCPNSTRINGGAGNAYILLTDQESFTKKEKDSMLLRSLTHFNKALKINPNYNDAYLNMGVAYSRLDNTIKAEECWNEARKIFPDHPKLEGYDQYLAAKFWDIGISYEKRKVLDSAIVFYSRSITYSHIDDTLKQSRLFHLGAQYYFLGNYQKSYETLGKLLEINPNHTNAREGYNACEGILRNQKKLLNSVQTN